MSRDLLLNPPRKRHFRPEGYGGQMVETTHPSWPLDLLLQSGSLGARSRVAVVDAEAEGLDASACIERVLQARARAILAATHPSTVRQDLVFLRRQSEASRVPIVLTGLGSAEHAREILRGEPRVQAVLLQPAAPGLAEYLDGGPPPGDLVYRRGQEILGPMDGAPMGEDLPLPLHGAFPLGRYRHSHVRRHPFAPLLTTLIRRRPCCGETPQRAMRSPRDLLHELERIRSLGIREVLMMDHRFGVLREPTLRFMEKLLRRAWRLDWSCWGAARDLDRELLTWMAEAGCRLVRMVTNCPASTESNQGCRLRADCRNLGIRVVAAGKPAPLFRGPVGAWRWLCVACAQQGAGYRES